MIALKSLFTLPLALSLAVSPLLAGDGESCHPDKAEAKAGSATQSMEIKTSSKMKKRYEARFPEIKREELVKAMENKAVFLVDANGNESYSSGHIPGAVSFEAAGENFQSLLPQEKSTLIVAYCGGPGCQAWCKAADKLQELGYSNIRHYKGGIKEWKSAGMTVRKATPDEKG